MKRLIAAGQLIDTMEHKAQIRLQKPLTLLLIAGFLALSACNGFDIEPAEQGMMSIRLTDSPSDNPDVDSVFATIASIKVDGRIISGFSGPKTINITALQNGNTELLGIGKLVAQNYQTITLDIDFEHDDQGEPMGVYYLSRNGSKVKLASGNQRRAGYSFLGTSRVYNDDTTSVVLDFDLRKFIKTLEDGSIAVATNSELAGYLRFVDVNLSGTIKGSYTGTLQPGNQIIAYAYKRGSFNAQIERKGKGGIQFLNSVASSAVASGGFFLPFIEEAEYEIHFVSFSPSEKDMVFEGYVNATNELEGESLNTIRTVAGTETTVNVIANGLLN